MIFAGIITGIVLTVFAVFMMAAFHEAGKKVGYLKGVEDGKKIFNAFKANELEYVLVKDLPDYLANVVDRDGNKLPDWAPILIVKPNAMEASINVNLKGE